MVKTYNGNVIKRKREKNNLSLYEFSESFDP